MATAVSVSRTNNAEIDGLLGGTRWSGSISYSFPDSPSDYPGNYYGDGEPTTSGYAMAPSAMQQAVVYALGLISGYTNITFQYNGNGFADIMVAQSPAANPTSYAYYPANVPAGGDIADQLFTVRQRQFRPVLAMRVILDADSAAMAQPGAKEPFRVESTHSAHVWRPTHAARRCNRLQRCNLGTPLCRHSRGVLSVHR